MQPCTKVTDRNTGRTRLSPFPTDYIVSADVVVNRERTVCWLIVTAVLIHTYPTITKWWHKKEKIPEEFVRGVWIFDNWSEIYVINDYCLANVPIKNTWQSFWHFLTQFSSRSNQSPRLFMSFVLTVIYLNLVLNSTVPQNNDPQPQMILDRKWSPKSTANDPVKNWGMEWILWDWLQKRADY